MPTDPHPSEPPHLRLRADLPAGARLRVTVEGRAADGTPLQRQSLALGDSQAIELELPVQAGWRSRLSRAWQAHGAAWLLAGALAVYLVTRLAALADYPIFFFTDEANQTLLALDLWRDGLRGADGVFLPTFFNNVYQYNLGVSVYLQLIPSLLFGRSIELTRGVAALATLLAPLWLALAARQTYRSAAPWLAALLLSVTPAWFLHSRTAFETSLAVTCYAGLLYFYLRYRGGQAWGLYGAVVCGALAFYSYSPAQVVVLVTALLFGVTDWRYHWQQRALVLRALGLGLLCGLPYLRFWIQHPGENLNHLLQIDSYLVQPGPWTDKLAAFGREYLRGLNPAYWYAPFQDAARHTMDGFGNLLAFTFPLGLGGVALAAWRVRRWEYRVPLLAVLAAPSGAALVGIGITRLLFMVVPMALLAALATEELGGRLARRWKTGGPAWGVALWIGLVGFNLYLLGAALVNGPTWSADYGLGGMQYGARQVFGAALDYQQAHPDATVVVSPTWTNGTDVVARFLLPDPSLVQLDSIDHWLNEKQPLDDNMLFILPPEELERAQDSGKFSRIQEVGSLPWPDGRPGFYLLHLAYVPDIDRIMAAELRDRYELESAHLVVEGQPLLVQYSRLDMGAIQNVFDGDLATFARTSAANPMVLQIEFPAPRRLTGVTLQIGGAASILDVSAEVEGESQTYMWRRQVGDVPMPRPLNLDFEGELPIRRLELRLKNTRDGEPAHVHLWEVTFP